jgi:purine-binding chemotaxis protein CheW
MLSVMINVLPSSGQRESDFRSVNRYAVFRRCGQLFALSIDLVSEVLPAHSLTRVPRAPDLILGVLSLRGEILPLLTLDHLLGLEASATDADSPILVLRQGD